MLERILVTGAAGYLGSILVPELLAQGHRVTALDTFARNDTVFASLCADPRFDPVRGDARDEDLVKRLVSEVDVVIPLAALVGAPMCKQDPINRGHGARYLYRHSPARGHMLNLAAQSRATFRVLCS